MKVIVWAPPYRLSSGGVRLLHYLCHCLNLAGYDAYVPTKIVNPELKTPFCDTPDDDTIVIYPEIASDNPLKAKHYAIYMLNIPGKLGGDKVYSDDLVAFGNWPIWEEEFKRAAKNYKGIVTLGIIDTNVFYKSDVKKTENMLFVYKGTTLREKYKFAYEEKMWVTEGDIPLEEFANRLRKTHTLYTYDKYTALTYEAYLCGCRIVIMGEDGIPYEWKPDPDFLKAVCRDDEIGKKQATKIMEIILNDLHTKKLMKENRMDIQDYEFSDNKVVGLNNLIKKYVKSDFKMVEIGSYKGVSTELFALTNCRVLSVDPYDRCEGQKGFVALQNAEKEFAERMKRYSNVTQIHVTSKEAVKDILDNSLDLVYIDANHSYESIKEDIALWLPKIKKDGYIAGHDYIDAQIGVKEAVQELSKFPEIFEDSSWIIQKNKINKVLSLDEIADKYGCDKSPKYLHDYTKVYAELLESKRDEVKKVLEIGIGFPEQTPFNPKCAYGASIYMWRDYFPNAEIYAIDNDGSHLINEDRIHSYLCNQRDENQLKEVMRKIGNDFDLIIDDGSHIPYDQNISAKTLLPYIKENGCYIIEDIGEKSDALEMEKLSKSLKGYTSSIRDLNIEKQKDDRLLVFKREKKMDLKISIFTPCHVTTWLQELYDSIKDQDFYEWIVAYNGDAIPMDFHDPRVKTFNLPVAPEMVGPLKAFCCEQATGDILLELDSDDLLMPTAIEDVRKAFADHPDVGFVYSNTIHMFRDYEKINRFDEKYGWRYRELTIKGHVLDEHIHFEPTPNCISRIWFAPNHLRAFRKKEYDIVGGYNKKMRVLDDLDLMCKLYQVTKFYHIDKGLYLYRVHGANTWLKFNEEVQNNVFRIHDQYIERLALKWSRDNGLKAIELGGRMAAMQGFTTVDLKDADIIADLNNDWPFADGSVGVIRAYDVFEHLKDPIHTMKELHRVLAPGGYAIIQVPSTDGRGAFQDPTHVSYWNQNSFLYYTNAFWNKYIDCPVRFQAMRMYTTEKDANQVCWVVAHLVKLGTERVPGEVNI